MRSVGSGRSVLSRLSALAVLLCASDALARVDRVVVHTRAVVAGGASFGEAGPYEKLAGEIDFAFDPANAANNRIVDLSLAPRNDAGLVEAKANFMVLQPVEPPPGERVALVEVSNRGGKASLAYFNRARARTWNPSESEHFGDGFLMRQGWTVIWVGWQHDVPLREGALRLAVPIARSITGDALVGLVRADWVVDAPTSTLHIGHRNHRAYPVLDPDDPRVQLTRRPGRYAPREVIPRAQWSFARESPLGEPTPSDEHIYTPDGFEAGFIYELVYPARDPRVGGLGLAVIRDVMAYAKHDDAALFQADVGVAFGVSQTGRFLRHFVYQGFNTDEKGRKVYDGLLIHTAGAGRGSFNHRFAQPSRDAHRYSAFFYPTDIFPFSGATQRDAKTGLSDGLYAHQHDPEHLPKIFYTNTGYEYWGRAASLLHTTPDGEQDIGLLPNERIYHLASGQHFVGRFPPSQRLRLEGSQAYQGNPLDFLVTLRALLHGLVSWTRDETPPPDSRYPRLADGTLTSIHSVRFPTIPGVQTPTVAQQAHRADYGPRWRDGIIDNQPPVLGPAFGARVPQVDEAGNELGGVPTVETLAALATHYPWSLRLRAPASSNELSDFVGMFAPLPVTEAQRQASGDSRPSVEALYESRSDYERHARAAADSLVRERFLLPEDVERVVQRALATWDWLADRTRD